MKLEHTQCFHDGDTELPFALQIGISPWSSIELRFLDRAFSFCRKLDLSFSSIYLIPNRGSTSVTVLTLNAPIAPALHDLLLTHCNQHILHVEPQGPHDRKRRDCREDGAPGERCTDGSILFRAVGLRAQRIDGCRHAGENAPEVLQQRRHQAVAVCS